MIKGFLRKRRRSGAFDTAAYFTLFQPPLQSTESYLQKLTQRQLLWYAVYSKIRPAGGSAGTKGEHIR